MIIWPDEHFGQMRPSRTKIWFEIFYKLYTASYSYAILVLFQK